jgi:hypothetical protein
MVTGRVIHHASDYYSNECYEAESIKIIEPWDNVKNGVFGLRAEHHAQGSQAHTIRISELSGELVLALQCQVDVIERVVDYLGVILPRFDDRLSIRHSTCVASEGHDRLILLSCPSGLCGPDLLKLAERVLSDPILTYVIKRVYTFPSNGVFVDVQLSGVLTKISSIANGQIARVHAFPKSIDMKIIGETLLPKMAFHPKSYNSVLNIIFADGLFYASLVDRELAVGCGEHICALSSNSSLDVSKAAAKIREALIRMQLNPVFSRRVDLRGKICIDIGASPGGWSFFLRESRFADRVIAVDMGKLAEPIPPGVEHWKMKGEDAVTALFNTEGCMNTLGLYTCDMNCDPIDSVSLFLKALPLMSDSSIAVITFKRTERNKQRWEELKASCIERLRSCSRIDTVEEVHLVANTPNETTVFIGVSS